MIGVVVGGATGKLGSLVCELIHESKDLELVGGVVSSSSAQKGTKLVGGLDAVAPSDLDRVLGEADVYVDLTSPSAAEENLGGVPETGTNLVIGTTGISEEFLAQLSRKVEVNGVSAVLSPNFSIGINVFWRSCEGLARVLEDYDIEITEVHHNTKKDSPSGTAMQAAKIISQVTGIDRFVHGREGRVGRRGREIGIHSIRAGDVVGEHTVVFAGNNERIELTHKAHSRETFARGCLTAVRWVSDRRDGSIHDMNEVLGL